MSRIRFLVQAVQNNSDVLGARMMGGGFGGCTINIVKETAIGGLISELSVRYSMEMNKELTPYIAQIEDGTSALAISKTCISPSGKQPAFLRTKVLSS